MSIKMHLEQTVKALETEREKEVAIIKERVTREKIIPFNQEMDISRDKAIAEKQQALNETIVSHQEHFAKEKKEIIEAAEKKKAENVSGITLQLAPQGEAPKKLGAVSVSSATLRDYIDAQTVTLTDEVSTTDKQNNANNVDTNEDVQNMEIEQQ